MLTLNKWYKNKVVLVIILAIFSASSLLIIQGIWLKKAFEKELKNLETEVNRIIPEFLFFDQNLQVLNQGVDQLELSLADSTELFKSKIKHIIDLSLKHNHIEEDFEFAITNDNQILLSSNSNLNSEYKNAKYKKCINCNLFNIPKLIHTDSSQSKNFILVEEELNNSNSISESEKIFLSIYFPKINHKAIVNIVKQLITVVIFVILMISCFFYVLRILFKQKKISEIKDGFINNLTHEFKTPLASINLATSVLKKSLKSKMSVKDKKNLNLIKNESTSLEKQIDKVLHMAMADAGNFELDRESINLNDLIAGTIRSLRLIIENKEGEILVNEIDQSIFIKADPIHLSNAIYNLIDNALKYSLKKPRVKISAVHKNKTLEIVIQDNGIGIDEEIQKLIFNKFYRAQKSNESPGFGIGLSYVKQIIQLHGGTIILKSKLNQGSSFRIILPNSMEHA